MTDQSTELSVKEAIRVAAQFLHDLYDQTELVGLLLEEVELSGDEQYWLITFGFDVPRPPSERAKPRLGMALQPDAVEYQRVYKTIKVHITNGEFRAMKIRNV